MRRGAECLRTVISASRRTDLVAHYPEDLAARLRKFGPERVHTLVVWTKDPANLFHHAALRRLLMEVGQVFVHWTVTGLGGTFLEPQVPPWKRSVELLPTLIERVGDPRRVHWRYDPLVTATRGGERVSNVDLALFERLAESFAASGVSAVHTSFVTLYRKVTQRLAAQGVTFETSDPAARHEFLAQMKERAQRRRLRLLTCCEPDFPQERCIDGALLTKLHPGQEPARTERARGQRALCGCTASLDLGRYLPCPGQCLYCYAHPARQVSAREVGLAPGTLPPR